MVGGAGGGVEHEGGRRRVGLQAMDRSHSPSLLDRRLDVSTSGGHAAVRGGRGGDGEPHAQRGAEKSTGSPGVGMVLVCPFLWSRSSAPVASRTRDAAMRQTSDRGDAAMKHVLRSSGGARSG